MRVRRFAVPALVGALTVSGAGVQASALASAGGHARRCSASSMSTVETRAASISGIAIGRGCTVWAAGDDAGGGVLFSWSGHSWRRTHLRGLAEAELTAITVGSAATWVVGDLIDGAKYEPLVLRLTSRGWRRIAAPAPAVGAYGNSLTAVTTSGSEAFAVGASATTSPYTSQALVLRWNGTKWYPVPTPAIPHSVLTGLAGVALSSKSYGWAVGQSDTGTTPQALIEHWNGRRWSVAASPAVPGMLSGVSALSKKDAWAVGYQQTASGNAALIEHWNGKRWSVVPDPSIAVYKAATDGSYLNDVAAISPKDVMATGQLGETAGGALPILMRWNGAHWTTSKAPDPAPASSVTNLTAISGSAAAGFWLIGIYPSGGKTHSYALHR